MGLRIADCGLRSGDCGLGIADWGVRIAECGLRMSDWGGRMADVGFKRMGKDSFRIQKSYIKLFISLIILSASSSALDAETLSA
jgi:hypothetical protein